MDQRPARPWARARRRCARHPGRTGSPDAGPGSAAPARPGSGRWRWEPALQELAAPGLMARRHMARSGLRWSIGVSSHRSRKVRSTPRTAGPCSSSCRSPGGGPVAWGRSGPGRRRRGGRDRQRGRGIGRCHPRTRCSARDRWGGGRPGLVAAEPAHLLVGYQLPAGSVDQRAQHPVGVLVEADQGGVGAPQKPADGHPVPCQSGQRGPSSLPGPASWRVASMPVGQVHPVPAARPESSRCSRAGRRPGRRAR